MLKHKSNLFTDQQCKFTTKCLYNIKKSKKKKKMLQKWIGSKVIQNTYKMMAFMVYIQYDGFYCIQAAN